MICPVVIAHEMSALAGTGGPGFPSGEFCPGLCPARYRGCPILRVLCEGWESIKNLAIWGAGDLNTGDGCSRFPLSLVLTAIAGAARNNRLIVRSQARTVR